MSFQPIRVVQTVQGTPLRGLFETHLPVTDLDRALAFYRDVVGLDLAHVEASRQAAFFWIGSAGDSMLGLWATGAAPQRTILRVAFRTTLPGVLAAPQSLRNAGVAPLDLQGRPTDQPIVLAWLPAAIVCFRDPDGHELQYVAMIEDRARPEFGVITWKMWKLLRGSSGAGFSQTRR